MKNFTYTLNAIVVFLTLLIFGACSEEEFSYILIAENNVVETADQKKNCETCPSTIYSEASNKSIIALQKMNLEHQWIGGANQDNHPHPHTAAAATTCDTDFFTRYGSQMILSTTGDTSVERPLAHADITSHHKKVGITNTHGYKKTDGQSSYDAVNYNEEDNLYIRVKTNASGNTVYLICKKQNLE